MLRGGLRQAGGSGSLLLAWPHLEPVHPGGSVPVSAQMGGARPARMNGSNVRLFSHLTHCPFPSRLTFGQDALRMLSSSPVTGLDARCPPLTRTRVFVPDERRTVPTSPPAGRTGQLRPAESPLAGHLGAVFTGP